MKELKREFGRKAFHLLSLVYLGAYFIMGFPRVLVALGAWFAVVAALETARLTSERFNRSLMGFFQGLIRDAEKASFSGIFHTTAGTLAVMLMAGRQPRVVAAALACLAFGDAAAALAGKAWGRHRIPGGTKSIEGSLACFLVCLGAGAAAGLPWLPTAGGALAATIVELLPTTRFFNDNLWMPVAAATAMRALGGCG
jgi:dolichol kinase